MQSDQDEVNARPFPCNEFQGTDRAKKSTDRNDFQGPGNVKSTDTVEKIDAKN